MEKGDLGQPRAIPFLELEEDESQSVKFTINPEAEQYLKKMTNKKIAVLTIAGPLRSGKSFLANRFLKSMKGFAIGPTTMPCTKGIWLWGQPVSLNEDTDLLILDTEGLNSTQRDQTIDMKIFSISLLLSSYFVYNCFGHIDERAIENLSLLVHLSEHISVSSKQQSDSDFAKYFPHFHWVLRDFSLDLKGKTSNQYLEQALSTIANAGQDPTIKSKNDIRTKIRNYFRSRECTTVVRPLNEESKLAYIEDQQWDDLKPEFRDTVATLVKRVLQNMRPKMINGKGLTGEMLLNLAQCYVESINKGGVPEILTSLERVINNESKKIYESTVKEYMKLAEEKISDKSLPMPEDEILKRHREIVDILTENVMNSGQMIGHKEVQAIQSKLTKGFEKNLQTKLELNEEKIYAMAKKGIHQFQSSLQIPTLNEIEEGFADLRPKLVVPFKEQFDIFYQNFSKGMKGSKKKYVPFSDLMPKVIMDHYDRIIDLCEQLKEQELDEYREKLEIANSGRQHLQQSLDQTKQFLQELRDEKEEAMSNYSKMRDEVKKAKDKAAEEEDNLQLQIKELEIELNSYKNKNEKLRGELESKGSKDSKNRFEMEEKLLELEKDNEIIEEKLDKYKREIKRLTGVIEEYEENGITSTTASGSKRRTRAIDDGEEGDDELDSTNLTSQNETLVAEIMCLKRKITDLEEKNYLLSNGNGDEEFKASDQTDTMRVPESLAEEDEEKEVDEDEVLELCSDNEKLRELISHLFSNYKKSKNMFQKKTRMILQENNKLKAKIIDLERRIEESRVKDSQIEKLKKDNKDLNFTLDLKKKEESVTEDFKRAMMQLADFKAQNVNLETEKENLVYFIDHLIRKIKKKKDNHYDHAFSLLGDDDRESILEIYKKLGIKF